LPSWGVIVTVVTTSAPLLVGGAHVVIERENESTTRSSGRR